MSARVPARRSFYAQSWALGIAENFLKTVPRVRSNFAQLTGLGEFSAIAACVHALQTSQRKWRVLKKALRHLNDLEVTPSLLSDLARKGYTPGAYWKIIKQAAMIAEEPWVRSAILVFDPVDML